MLLEMTTGTATVQKRINAPPSTTGRDSVPSGHSIPEYTSRKQQKLSLKVSHKQDVDSTTTENSQNMEATLVPIHRKRYRRGGTHNSHTDTYTPQMEYYLAKNQSGFLFSGNWENLASLACLVTKG